MLGLRRTTAAKPRRLMGVVAISLAQSLSCRLRARAVSARRQQEEDRQTAVLAAPPAQLPAATASGLQLRGGGDAGGVASPPYVRLVCVVPVAKQHVAAKQSVLDSWGLRCDRVVFFVSEPVRP